ncbi:MAG TPA: hypothetical protein VGO11_22660 [Chthoniobacteraceae bacterium]|jgi:hypothetical protein|nr:hypothetical protein [Chthoniobacteraceae bacterium]
MQPRLLRLLALTSASSLLATGCAPVTPGETSGPGPFSGANAQLAAGNINRAGTANTAERLATGAPTNVAVVGVTAVIAKHQASARQREVAQARAKAVYQKLVAKQKASAQVSTHPPAPKPKHPQAGAKPTPEPQVAEIGLNGPRKPRPYRIPRYIAVETEKNAQDAPGTKKAVMIWDTQAQEIVGNNVYDIGTPPAVGSTSRFETFSAEYVGAGL